MSERTALHTAVERLAGRLRALPQRRLRAGAAAEGLELARWLARQAQLLEFPGREPYDMPDDGIFVVGDQLAVAGHELAAVADRDPGRAEGVLVEALRRLAVTAKAVG
ncbi:hypothetical protein [Actinacidiphila sp. ITFR-21]|uniref:hypothetical protein n=1 Tax=Actinacidiphila sp. ITFR-21 TaxID=3075199 RepID=UPI0028896273|nr:hypothetical protein [Streptomyces sp. ITFR-21]WNI15822.1 hypothetical protein RLT57_09985 [Streptomyces sp. ITFR-21]